MADKQIGELPSAQSMDDDSLLIVEQSSEALNLSGKLLRTYAETAAVAVVKDSVDAAKQSAADAEKSAQSAAQNARSAQDSAAKAKQSETAAKTAQTGSETAQAGAETARDAIENMTVSAETLPPGSDATVTKYTDGDFVRLHYGIPRGMNGTSVPANGMYAFDISEEGHLILSYTGEDAPNLSINEDGHLILSL